MTALFALRSLFFACELFAGSTLALLAASALASQKSASARHLVWASTFGSILLLPVFVAAGPSPLRVLLPAAQQGVSLQDLNEAGHGALAPTQTAGFVADPANIALLLGCLWLIGACALGLRFAIAAICLASFKRRSRPFALPPEALPRIAATRRECELRVSDSENGPITWGLLRPVILLPRTAVFWPRERMNAVLLHELAHIRRRDSIVQVMSDLACALYWPNPLVWVAARKLRSEAEMAADDAAIVTGLKPSRYAGELLELAAEFRMRRPALSALSLFMAERSALEARVESVLAPDAQRTGVTMKQVVKACGVGCASALVIAFVCPSLAQDSTPAAPAPSVTSAPAAPVAPPAPPSPFVPVAPPAPAAPQNLAPAADLYMTEADAPKHVSRKCLHADIARAMREARRAMARIEMGKIAAQMHASDDAIRAAQPEIAQAEALAAREAHDAMLRAAPEIERALAQARAGEESARAVHDVQPQIDAAVNSALAKARTELARAKIDAKIEARVSDALKRAEIRMEAAGRTPAPAEPGQTNTPDVP